MNENTKWEAGKAADLKPGDTVRVIHPDGNIFVGEVAHSGIGRIRGPFGEVWPHQWAKGYLTFERAVPVRVLPIVDGVYASAAQYATGDYVLFVFRSTDTQMDGWQCDEGGEWEHVSDRSLPDDLVRLVPITDVEEAEKRVAELEKRINLAIKSLEAQPFRDHTRNILVGGTK